MKQKDMHRMNTLQVLDPASYQAVMLMVEERVRQIKKEGMAPERDRKMYWQVNQLAEAAACYANPVQVHLHSPLLPNDIPSLWPWDSSWWKPTTERRNYEKAGALLIAALAVEICSEDFNHE
jgi:hypothetical protein